MFDRDTIANVEEIINLRNNFGLEKNRYLFGLPGTENPINGFACMQKHGRLALGPKKSSSISSTRLRKQLATITQIFSMEKNELQQLATFMGHTEKTHEDFYRLPDDVYQTAKISKLLLLSKQPDFEKYKGMKLKDIEVSDEAVVNESDDDDGDGIGQVGPELEENQDVVNHHNQIPDNNVSHNKAIKKKRTIIPWTSEQKSRTESFFKANINRKIPPKKDQVMALVETCPDIFRNKTWQQIKIYVCNLYNKK